MRPLLALLLVAAAAAFAQEGKKKEPRPPTAGEIDIPDPGTKVEDPAVARKEVVLFQAEMRKTSKKNVRKRVELMERLGQWDHPMVLREAKKHLKDKSYKVAVAAVVACARQSSDREATAAGFLAQLKKEKRTNVICALLVGMGRLEYTSKKAYKVAADWYGKKNMEALKASARYFGYIQSKRSFRLLAEKLDYPRPEKVDDPENPPAEWWEERYKEWESYVPQIRWALGRIVPGETFETTKEAKDWAKAEGAEHGIKW
ncbi:MAG: hypothetical protein ACYSX0_07545 [Planctomycetota bacterium]|jgi:hypothetical protein